MAAVSPRAPRRTPLVAGNWKMNLNQFEAIALVQKLAVSLTAEEFAAVEVVVLPPFTDLRSVQTCVDGDRLPIRYGAQDLSQRASGAFTGDIGGPMLATLGCSYVVVGHSERREYHGEDDETVRAKVAAAYQNGLRPILCVGEGEDVRERADHIEHTADQVRAALRGIAAEPARELVVAYEPIWAIGTGKTATPGDAEEVCAALRTTLAELYTGDLADDVRILYGGSVNADNARDLLAPEDVDGALVGGASLDATVFAQIARAAI